MKKIKLISIWNPKGGQGKSMLAINLAAAAIEIGLKPLVICQDPQGTSTNYFKGGNLPFEVIGQIPEEKPDVDLIFFDHQASDWEVPSNHLLVMPLKPARDQYATYIDAFKRADTMEKKIITVVTDGSGHRKSEKTTSEYLEEQGAFVIPSSGVFSRASSEYRTIFDVSLNKAYKIGDRRREMSKILGAILIEQSENNKIRE
ncbi:MAG: AAA family ATPase [Methylomarinum sp.]|nr:AAA family ATPase [Methylomarinum sp.]